LTTSVGGIPEIFGRLSDRLVPPGDSRKLAQAITAVLDNPDAARTSAQALQARIRQHFSVDAMTEKVLAAYGEALDRRTGRFAVPR
jgi:glycosyltransferase involved in cell wall biosynthesis